MNSAYKSVKRLADVFFSCVGLVILAVPMACIAIAVKIGSRGPVFFRAERIGQHEKIFTMYKFRSFVVDAPVIPPNKFVSPEQYMTPIGRVLRRLSLDELPQLFNVLKGDMSIVGPRPGSAERNERELAEERRRHGVFAVRPGITGWAQVNGRDELAHDITKKVAFDAYYVTHLGPRIDMLCLLRTLHVVGSGAGYHEGVASGDDHQGRVA